MSDKKDLLGALKIDKSERQGRTGASKNALALAVLPILLAAAAWLLWPDGGDQAPSDDVLAASDPASAAADGESPESPESSEVGDLTAMRETRVSSTRVMQAQSAPQSAASPSGQSGGSQASAGEEILNASGYITARRQSTVSAEITGLITDVLIEEGMRVEKGQVLARLDPAIAQADYDTARARLQRSRADVEVIAANLSEAERELRRATQLETEQFASEARVTQAQTNVAALQAQLRSARAQVDISRFDAARLKARLDDHTIRAPFAGVITVKAAQEGEIVSPVSAGGGFTRTGIGTIVDMASLEIEVDVNESFIARVSEGQRVMARLDAYPDWEIPAEVIAVIPTANRDKATVQVRIGLKVSDARILPEMGVRVAFYAS